MHQAVPTWYSGTFLEMASVRYGMMIWVQPPPAHKTRTRHQLGYTVCGSPTNAKIAGTA